MDHQDEDQVRDVIHSLRYREPTYRLSNNDDAPAGRTLTLRLFFEIVAVACGGFAVFVMICWWTLLMTWLNPQPVYSPEADAALFTTCNATNWNGLDVFLTIGSLAYARALQAPFLPPYQSWGIRLLLLTPVLVPIESLWLWICLLWALFTKRSIWTTCAALRMMRMNCLRSDLSLTTTKDTGSGGKQWEGCAWNYQPTSSTALKDFSDGSSSKPQGKRADDRIANNLVMVSQRRNRAFLLIAYALVLFDIYKLSFVTGAGVVKGVAYIYGISFVASEIIYLVPNPESNTSAATSAVISFFHDVHDISGNPFDNTAVLPIITLAGGCSYTFAVATYSISQLFGSLASYFPDDYNGSIALTTAIRMAVRMLLILPLALFSLLFSLTLPIWALVVRRSMRARQPHRAFIDALSSPWAWLGGQIDDPAFLRSLCSAMLLYAGAAVWFSLFWNLVRVHHGTFPFVQHSDLVYNCSLTARDAESWLFLT